MQKLIERLPSPGSRSGDPNMMWVEGWLNTEAVADAMLADAALLDEICEYRARQLNSATDTASRGFCPVCKRWMLLKKDGRLRHHGGPEGSGGPFHDRRSYRCDGAGKVPGEVREGASDD